MVIVQTNVEKVRVTTGQTYVVWNNGNSTWLPKSLDSSCSIYKDKEATKNQPLKESCWIVLAKFILIYKFLASLNVLKTMFFFGIF